MLANGRLMPAAPQPCYLSVPDPDTWGSQKPSGVGQVLDSGARGAAEHLHTEGEAPRRGGAEREVTKGYSWV